MASNLVADGLMAVGDVVEVEWSDSTDGFSNVKLECHRFSGEPYWFRAAFVAHRQDGQPTRVGEDMRDVEAGDRVTLAVEAKAAKSGRGVWFKAYAVTVHAEEEHADEAPAASPGRRGKFKSVPAEPEHDLAAAAV